MQNKTKSILRKILSGIAISFIYFTFYTVCFNITYQGEVTPSFWHTFWGISVMGVLFAYAGIKVMQEDVDPWTKYKQPMKKAKK
jgi:hypothetical protein